MSDFPTLGLALAVGKKPGDTLVESDWYYLTTRLRPKWSLSRGLDPDSGEIRGGEFHCELRNTDGLLDPKNTSSPLYGQLKLHTPLRLQATRNYGAGNVTSTLFRGFLLQLEQTWVNHGRYGIALLSAADGMNLLEGFTFPDSYYQTVLDDAPAFYYRMSDLADDTTAATTLASAFGGGIQKTAVDPFTGQRKTINYDGKFAVAGNGGSAINGDPDQSMHFGAAGAVAASGTPAFLDAMYSAANTVVLWECWVYLDSIPLNSRGMLLAQDDAGTNLKLNVGATASTARFNYSIGSDSVSSTTVPVAGRWYHVAAYHKKQVEIGIYVNGVLESTTSLASVTIRSPYSTQVLMGSRTAPNAVATGQGNTTSERLIGYLDEVACYVIPPSDDYSLPDIVGHYAAGISAHGFVAEGRNARAINVLTTAGWPTALTGFTSGGGKQLVATGDLAGQSALSLLQTYGRCQDELFVCDRNGVVKYLPAAPTSGAPTWTFGDGDGELPYLPNLSFSADEQLIVNDARIAQEPDPVTGRTGRAGQAIDQASIDQHLRKPYRDTLPLRKPADLQALATALVARRAEPVERPRDSLVVEPSSNPALWQVALQGDIGEQVRVIRRPQSAPSTQRDARIAGVRIVADGPKWTTTFPLLPQY